MLPKFLKFFTVNNKNGLNNACRVLEEQKNGIPFQAISYLRKQPSSKELQNRIIFALSHAYSDIYYDVENEYWRQTPLWYAVVAEKHLSKQLIDPVISLYTTSRNDGDFLNDQGMFVLGQLAKKYPKIVMEKVVWVVDYLIKKQSDLAYLFLFDVFCYADVRKYKQWFLTTLQKDFIWRESFVGHLSDLRIKESVPIIKNLLAKIDNQHERIEFKAALEDLETKNGIYSEYIRRPYFKKRGNWYKHYKSHEATFYDNENEENEEDSFIAKKKIRRNAPCPCGALKSNGQPMKYKKCCGRDV